MKTEFVIKFKESEVIEGIKKLERVGYEPLFFTSYKDFKYYINNGGVHIYCRYDSTIGKNISTLTRNIIDIDVYDINDIIMEIRKEKIEKIRSNG